MGPCAPAQLFRTSSDNHYTRTLAPTLVIPGSHADSKNSCVLRVAKAPTPGVLAPVRQISHMRSHRSQCLSPKENPNCLIWCPSCTKGNSTLAVQRSALPLWFAVSAGHDPRTGAQSSLHNPCLICPRGGPYLGSLKLLIHLAHILKHSRHRPKSEKPRGGQCHRTLSPKAPCPATLGVLLSASVLLNRPIAA